MRIWEFGDWFLKEEISEKGNTRKHTKKRVTSWSFLYWRNSEVSRCFAKRIVLGEFQFGLFWGFTQGST
jgi:hypothetical protein